MEKLVDCRKCEVIGATPVQWLEMSPAEISQLAVHLVSHEDHASIKQYPAFNERFRRFLSKPTYLKCVDGSGATLGFVGLISLAFPGIRCGFVIDGPVFFGGRPCEDDHGRALVAWLRSHGYAFVRFSHRDPAQIQSFALWPEAVRENPLPFILRYGSECVISLKADDAEMHSGFQQTARKEIRRAREAGSIIRRSSNLKDFQNLWPIFTKRAKEKGFPLQNLERYESMFALSRREDLARLYTCYYNDLPVFPVLLLRERAEVYGMLGALDKNALGDKPSPCCLVYWTIMREYRDLGCLRFNMGQPTGSVYALKRKFRPSMTPSPFTITLVVNPRVYRIWIRVIMRTIGTALRGVKMLRGG